MNEGDAVLSAISAMLFETEAMDSRWFGDCDLACRDNHVMHTRKRALWLRVWNVFGMIAL